VGSPEPFVEVGLAAALQVYALLMRVPGIGIAKENNTSASQTAAAQ
jgi:hypothetical protein